MSLAVLAESPAKIQILPNFTVLSKYQWHALPHLCAVYTGSSYDAPYGGGGLELNTEYYSVSALLSSGYIIMECEIGSAGGFGEKKWEWFIIDKMIRTRSCGNVCLSLLPHSLPFLTPNAATKPDNIIVLGLIQCGHSYMRVVQPWRS